MCEGEQNQAAGEGNAFCFSPDSRSFALTLRGSPASYVSLAPSRPRQWEGYWFVHCVELGGETAGPFEGRRQLSLLFPPTPPACPLPDWCDK